MDTITAFRGIIAHIAVGAAHAVVNPVAAAKIIIDSM
jgi:hypothetical protein